MTEVLATVCARGGSKGVPGKNIRPLLGKPLIAHTIAQARACARISRVVVSTDSEEIARAARDAGAEVPFLRPTELASDSSAKMPAIRHCVAFLAASGYRPDFVIDLDPTSPLRGASDIEACLALAEEPGVESVITAYLAEKNPYFNMVELDGGGRPRLSKGSPAPFVCRQDAPAVYSMNASIYVWRAAALTKGLWETESRLHVMPRDRSIDIDSELDFFIVESLMRRREDASI